MLDFVALDLETTGLDFVTAEIIEVALVRFRGGKPAETFDTLVRPQGELRDFIARLTGISAEELQQARVFADAAPDIVSFIGELPLVAHNAHFDGHFLRKELSACGLDPTPLVFLDSLTTSRIVCQDAPNHRLETLVRHLGIERTQSHRALPDAQACGELFVYCLQQMDGYSPFEKAALQQLAQGTPWAQIFPASPLAELPVVQPRDTSPTPPPPTPAQTPSKRVSAWFGEDGLLKTLLPDFRDIPHQRDLAECSERNMHKGGTLVAEASPGMGKTLAYLVPAALRAADKGERVVIATATRTLQEQIWNKDLPVLAQALQGSLRPALLKGRSNYLCLRKFQEHLEHPELLTAEEREPFMALIPWVERTATGDAGENSGFNMVRNKQVWAKLASEASSCLGPACRFHAQCFGLNSRRRAAEANFLVTNHALFLQDMALDFSLLPAYEHIVFDEAHRLPNASHQSMGKEVWFYRLRNLLKILVHVRAEERGLLAQAQSLWPVDASDALPADCKASVNDTERQFHKLLMKLGKGSRKLQSKGNAPLFREPVAAIFDADPQPFLEQLDALCSRLQNLAQRLRDQSNPEDRSAGLARDLDGVHSELVRFRHDVDFLTHAGRADWAYWLEEPANPHTLRIKAVPLDPGTTWREKFFPWVRSALFTSGTLAVQGKVDHFCERMGLASPELPKNKAPFVRVYRDSAQGIPRDHVVVASFLPKPNAPEYQGALEALLCEILPKEDRNTLVLFTSIQSLEGVHAKLAPLFALADKPLFSQHADGSAESLLDLFRQQRGACLLGTQSLWEGVDLPGDALQLLIIPKLPFPSPTEPLIAARAERLKEAGGNPFKDVFVPEAMIALRQGMGRLLRSPQDSGTILLLDNRILTEGYGKGFARLWDNRHRVAKSIEELQG